MYIQGRTRPFEPLTKDAPSRHSYDDPENDDDNNDDDNDYYEENDPDTGSSAQSSRRASTNPFSATYLSAASSQWIEDPARLERVPVLFDQVYPVADLARGHERVS